MAWLPSSVMLGLVFAVMLVTEIAFLAAKTSAWPKYRILTARAP